jgi:hypothetical protein
MILYVLTLAAPFDVRASAAIIRAEARVLKHFLHLHQAVLDARTPCRVGAGRRFALPTVCWEYRNSRHRLRLSEGNSATSVARVKTCLFPYQAMARENGGGQGPTLLDLSTRLKDTVVCRETADSKPQIPHAGRVPRSTAFSGPLPHGMRKCEKTWAHWAGAHLQLCVFNSFCRLRRPQGLRQPNSSQPPSAVVRLFLCSVVNLG